MHFTINFTAHFVSLLLSLGADQVSTGQEIEATQ